MNNIKDLQNLLEPLSKIELEQEERQCILENVLREDVKPSLPSKYRKRAGTLMTGVAATVAVVAFAGITTTVIQHKKVTTAGQSQTIINVSWPNVPSQIQSTVKSISSVYGESAPNITEITRVSSGQLKDTYTCYLGGKFHKGNTGADLNVLASKLVISVADKPTGDISTEAYNAQGKLVWQQNNGLFNNDNVVFIGKSNHWSGTFRITGVRMMVQTGDGFKANSNDQYTYQIKYTGQNASKIGSVNFSFDADGSMSFSDQKVLPPMGIISGVAGGSTSNTYRVLPNTVKLVIHWRNQIETIHLTPSSK